MNESTAILLNPKGNLNRDGRAWLATRTEALRRLAPAEVLLVESPEEAEQATRQSAMRGYRKFICAGLQGIAHGMVNGLMSLAESHRKEIKAGFLSLTRPTHWGQTLDLPRDLQRQLDLLDAGHVLPFDLGRVNYLDDQGQHATRYFLDGACFGLTSDIRREWRDPAFDLFKTLGRMARGVERNTQIPVWVDSDKGRVFEGHVLMGVVMSGRHYPNLGRVAPQADPVDGLLDMGWVTSQSRLDAVGKLAKAYLLRSRIALPDWHRGSSFTLETTRNDVCLELDGLPVGRLPASFATVPRALNVIVESVAVKMGEKQKALLKKVGNGNLAGNIKSPMLKNTAFKNTASKSTNFKKS